MRVGIYVRVSTAEQVEEGYSVGEQTDRLKKYCEAKGWGIHQVYTDAGFSGSNIERPAMVKMQKDIHDKKLDLVLVYKLDRLSRSQKDTLFLIEDVFLKNNVDFVSMNENFDTSTPFGRAMIGILSVFAQLEREQIRERMAMGRAARAKDGYFHGGGFAPVGYDYVDGELIVDDYEAMQVRKVHELFLQGLPINRIQVMMNNKYKNKHGSWGNHSAVRNVLTNVLYTGKIEWQGELYDGRHDPIIDEETFKKSVKRYDAISWKKGSGEHKHRPFQAKHLLTGLLYCGNCGARYFAKGNHSGIGENRPYYPYYVCYSRAKTQKRMVIDPDCKNKSYPVIKLDEVINNEIKKLVFDPTYFQQIQEPEQKTAVNDNAVIEERLVDIDKQITRLLDLYQLGSMPFDIITERIEALNAEKTALADDLTLDNPIIPELTKDEAEALLEHANDILDNGTLEERRELVHSLINHIELVDEDIVIHWSFT